MIEVFRWLRPHRQEHAAVAGCRRGPGQTFMGRVADKSRDRCLRECEQDVKTWLFGRLPQRKLVPFVLEVKTSIQRRWDWVYPTTLAYETIRTNGYGTNRQSA